MEQEGQQDCVIVFAQAAKKDILEIADYTHRTWGAAQSDAYVDLIIESARSWQGVTAAARLEVEGELLYKKLVRWRGSRYGHHLYFIVGSSGEVVVLRVLHTSQAPPTDEELAGWLEHQ